MVFTNSCGKDIHGLKLLEPNRIIICVLLFFCIGITLHSNGKKSIDNMELTEEDYALINGVYNRILDPNLSSEREFSWGVSRYNSMSSILIDLGKMIYEEIGNYATVLNFKKLNKNKYILTLESADYVRDYYYEIGNDGIILFYSEGANPENGDGSKLYKVGGPGTNN